MPKDAVGIVVDDERFVGNEDFTEVGTLYLKETDLVNDIPKGGKTNNIAHYLSGMKIDDIKDMFEIIPAKDPLVGDIDDIAFENMNNIDSQNQGYSDCVVLNGGNVKVTFYEGDENNRKPVEIIVSGKVPKKYISDADDDPADKEINPKEIVTGWFAILLKAYTVFIHRDKNVKLDIDETLKNAKKKDFLDAISRSGFKTTEINYREYTDEIDNILNDYEKKGGLHIYDESNSNDLLIKTAYKKFEKNFPFENISVTVVIDGKESHYYAKHSEGSLKIGNLKIFDFNNPSDTFKYIDENGKEKNAKIKNFHILEGNATVENAAENDPNKKYAFGYAKETIIDLQAFNDKIKQYAKQASDKRRQDAMKAYKLEKKHNKKESTNNGRLIDFFEKYSYEEFEDSFKNGEDGVKTALNKMINFNASKPGASYKELALVKACQGINKNLDCNTRKQYPGSQLYALLKLKYAQMVEENIFYETNVAKLENAGIKPEEKHEHAVPTAENGYGFEFENICADLSAMKKLLDDGDSIYRGSSREYKNIKKEIDETEKYMKKLAELVTKKEENSRKYANPYVYEARMGLVKLETLRMDMEKYIRNRERTEILEPRNSYKGKRIRLMREAHAKLNVNIKFFNDNFRMFKGNLIGNLLEKYKNRLENNLKKNGYNPIIHAELAMFDVEVPNGPEEEASIYDYYIGMQKDCIDKEKVDINKATDPQKSAIIIEIMSALRGKNVDLKTANRFKKIIENNLEIVYNNCLRYKNIDRLISGVDDKYQISTEPEFDEAMKKSLDNALKNCRMAAGIRPNVETSKDATETEMQEALGRIQGI